MYSGDDDDEGGKSQEEQEIEGVRVPCRDAKRRVWQAIDLLKQEHKTHNGSPKAVSVRQQSSPSSEKKNPHRAAGGGI
jgi:hypothetical protein